MTTIDAHAAYRHLFRESNDGLILIDPDEKKVIDVNPTLQRLTGFRKKQILQMELGDLILGENLDESLRLSRACESTCFFHSKEGYFLRTDEGSPLAVSLSASRIHTDASTVTLLTIRDITERLQAQRVLSEHQVQLAHASRLSTVGELAAAIVHEITQPIGAIANYTGACLKLLEDRADEESEVIGYLNEVASGTQRIGRLIQRIRGYVKESDHVRAACVVDDIIHESVALMGPEIERHQIAVDLALQATPACSVSVNRLEIQQVLVNLLKNACESIAESRTPEPRIRIHASSSDAMTQIAVEDNGAGLKEDLDRLFDPFYTTRPDGMGMGLAICRTIVEAHSGKIWAEANAGGGATFTFTVPKAEVRTSEP